MKQYDKWRAVKSKLIYALLAVVFIAISSGFAVAQTTDTPPDFPTNNNTLVDPNAADFSSDIFSEDFGTDGTNDATDTTATDTTATETETTVTAQTMPATTTVPDTTSGPKENGIFWISFLGTLLVLQTTRQLLKEKQQNDVF